MNKIIVPIIGIILLFSSTLSTNASEGKLGKAINLNFAVEQIDYKLSELPEKTFKNEKVQEKYDAFRKINQVLTGEFYKKYKAGEIDYYTTKGIISHHQRFIYNTEKLFEYIELKLENPKYVDVDEDIIESYSQMRMSYKRIKFLYAKSK